MVRRHIALVGMMGSGKSTVARELARIRFGAWADADELISVRAGRSIPEIFAKEGEAGFRAKEWEVIEDILMDPVPHVVATGGGAFAQPALQRMISSAAVVVYLWAEVETLVKRVSRGKGRPLLEGEEDIAEKVAGLVAQREFYYRRADLVVDVSGDNPTRIAEDLSKLLPATA